MELIELSVDRMVKSELTTIGSLSINKKYFCFILEDKDRGLNQNMSLDQIKKIKQYGITAIPAGKYRVVIVYSPHFKMRVPLLQNVPGYSAIEIHPGNTAKDTLGCLLTGYKHGQDNITAGTSRAAFNDLMKILDKPNVEITITIG